jgi:hypothetical protein
VVDLVVGARRIDRRLSAVEHLLAAYRTDDGLRYLDWRPSTDPDRLMPEDLAVTILINSRVGPAAFKSAQDHGAQLDLAGLPDMPLEETSVDTRAQVARLIADVAGWDGFAASVATKVLHKKRPRLIPILDNQAIFGAYMNPHWPGRRWPWTREITAAVTRLQALPSGQPARTAPATRKETNTRTRGTPPTRRDSRAAGHGQRGENCPEPIPQASQPASRKIEASELHRLLARRTAADGSPLSG